MITATAPAPAAADLDRRIQEAQRAVRLAEFPEVVQIAALRLAELRAQRRRLGA